MEKIQKIPVPKGTTEVEVRIDGPNYPLVLVFNDESEATHYFLEDGFYDGHSVGCKGKKNVSQSNGV